MNKKLLTALCAIGLSASTLAACSTGAQAERNSDGEVVIQFWHASGGDQGKLIDQAVEEFNQEYDGKYEVQAVYQGSYENNFAKLAANIQTGFVPGLMQANDVQTAYMKDSGLAIPVEDALGDKAAAIKDDLLPAVQNYYVIDGKLWSMPLLVSQPEAYINLDILKEAGVDPNSLNTFDDYFEAANTIYQKTGTPGLSFATNSWFAEEFTANLGELYCTPDNGVKSDRATQINLTNQANLDLWKKVQEGFDNGSIANVGSSQGAVGSLFRSHNVAMAFISSAQLSQTLDSDVNSQLKPLPAVSEEYGSVPGGNSLWILKEGKTDEEIAGATAFAEFINRPEIQARNMPGSGYLPSTKAAYEMNVKDPDLKPQQIALVNNLANTPANDVTAGCHMGSISEIRTSVGNAMEGVARGDDPKQAFDKIQAEIDRAVTRYERRAALTDK